MDYLQYYNVKSYYSYKKCVLNLIINGLPSIWNIGLGDNVSQIVLNLIINGLPSI